MKKLSSEKLPLVQALLWIISSTALISGSAYLVVHRWNNKKKEMKSNDFILSIAQTGPQKEALRSEYLSELIGLSRDFPILTTKFDVEKARFDLLESPLIQEVFVKTIKPSTVYIDYTVRQPIAWIYDYENVGIDKEGFLIPMYPFFPPKNLPEIYLGLAPFGQIQNSMNIPTALWNKPLQGDLVDLAFDIFNKLLLCQKDLFRIKRIDVSKSRDLSLGKREIVLVIDNDIYLKDRSEPVTCTHYLRLSVSRYSQELGNYLELRKRLLEEYSLSSESAIAHKIIDLRLTDLAYVEDAKN